MTAMADALRVARQRRQARRDLTELDGILATPHDLGSGPLVIPAGARLAVSHSAGLTSGQVTVAIGDRLEFSHPALAADAVHRGDWAERGMSISQTGAPTGTLSLYIVDPFDGTARLVATQVVA